MLTFLYSIEIMLVQILNFVPKFHHYNLVVGKGPSSSRLYGSWILQLSVQSVPITTKVVSSNPACGRVTRNNIM